MIPDSIIIEYILEGYVWERIQRSEKTALGFFKNIYSTTTGTKTLTEVHEAYMDILKRFSEAEEIILKSPKEGAKAYIAVIIEMGEKAFTSQELSNGDSAYSERLHAVRSYAFQEISKSQHGRNAITETIDKLREEYNNENERIAKMPNNDSNKDMEVKNAIARRHGILRKLAYIGCIEQELRDNIDTILPKLKYPPKRPTTTLRLYNKKIDPTLPYVIHDDYFSLYINKDYLENPSTYGKEVKAGDFEDSCYQSFAKKFGQSVLSAHVGNRRKMLEIEQEMDKELSPYVSRGISLNVPTPMPSPHSSPHTILSQLSLYNKNSGQGINVSDEVQVSESSLTIHR